MKVLDILSNLREGQIVTDKRVLATLKRRGLIYDYSQWGYLESAKCIYVENDGYHNVNYGELFPDGNAPKEYETICDSKDAYYEFIRNGDIYYHGYTFTYKYVSGCFKPYLEFKRYTPAFYEVKA